MGCMGEAGTLDEDEDCSLGRCMWGGAWGCQSQEVGWHRSIAKRKYRWPGRDLVMSFRMRVVNLDKTN